MRQELNELKFETGLFQRIDCSKEQTEYFRQILKEGNSLPEGVYQYRDGFGEQLDKFYMIHDTNLSKEEREEYIALKQYVRVNTIKNCVIFFTVLMVLSLIASFILVF